MNILIIGNGFDKAFGLPTSYTDFLTFTEAINDVNLYFKEQFRNYSNYQNLNEKQKAEFKALINSNKFLQYFSAISKHTVIKYNSPNWIDFEEELKCIIKIFDNCYIKDVDGEYRYKQLDIPNDNTYEFAFSKDTHKNYIFLKIFFPLIFKLDIRERRLVYNNDFIENVIINKSEAIKSIYDSFCEFCNLFELYCSEYINNISICPPYENLFLGNPDWRLISAEVIFQENRHTRPKLLPLMGFDKVLSFNYTETYTRIYVSEYEVCEDGRITSRLSGDEPEMCYVHGKAGDGNIIIGIDEYLDNDKRNSEFDFIEFKKYYQRINKKTGSTYRDWLKTTGTKNAYYIGHSFAETDYDILREFLMNDDVKNTILYHTPERKKELIQRVINIIGQEELIKRVHGADWTIRFEPQEEFLFSEKNTVFMDSLKSSEKQLVTQ
jgi:hypothetical protein